MIMPRDISDGSLINTPFAIDVNSVSALEKHRLRPGEILIVNKGFKFGTFLYEGIPEKAIATSSFFVITPNPQKLVSRFLLWYLNQPPAREYFSKSAFGSTIPSIPLNVLANLKVPEVSLDIQSYIGDLLVEMQMEQYLMKELTVKREAFFNSHIWEQISK